jgi:hypothetical protein
MAAALAALLGCAVMSEASELSIYRCPKVSTPPRIDGRLDDQAWKHAPVVELVDTVTGRPAVKPTRARMCWDDRNLYVAFDCVDQDIRATFTKRDDLVFEEEVVEVFLDPDGNPGRYFEIEVSPRNVIFDATIVNIDGSTPDKASDFGWNCAGLRTAVVVDGTLDNLTDTDRGWTAEFAIPFRSLRRCAPKPGEQWRGNLYRIDRFPPPFELQAWSPTLHDPARFHVPKRFGTILFAPTST